MFGWLMNFLNSPAKLREAERMKDYYIGKLAAEEKKSSELNDKLQEKIIQISELEAAVPRPDSHEEFWNNKYPKKTITYSCRTFPKSNRRFAVDVRLFFTNIDSALETIVKTKWVDIGRLNTGDFNKRALKCLKWVRANFKYAKDIDTTGVSEHWSFPFEALYIKKGDCDDGAILLANLMLAAGIPYWRIRLNAGDVGTKAKKFGHLYVTYCRETDNNFVVLDWTFKYNDSIVGRRPLHRDERDYYGIWFSWNKRYAFGEMQTMKNMPKTIKVKR